MTSFYIRIEGDDTLEVSQVWPDGDAPENPTAHDVAEECAAYGPLHRWLIDWRMDHSVRVYVDHVEVKF